MSIYRKSQHERLDRASREAAEWLQVMRGAPDSDARQAFAAWIQASPLHVRELLVASMVEKEVSAQDALAGFDVDAIVARARVEPKVASLREYAMRVQPGRTYAARHAGRQRLPIWARVAVLAGVALLGGAGLWLGLRPAGSTAEYTTITDGRQHAIVMPDGTVVTLGSQSRISADFSGRQRNVTLDYGEARFEVTHDAARPFRVYAGATVVQDVGTEFTVNRLPSGTVVNVIEGKVTIQSDHASALNDGVGAWVKSWLPADVAAIKVPGAVVMPLDGSRDLVAGDSAHITTNGRDLVLRKLGHERGSVDTARLTFNDATLADIAAEFNRYNSMKIVVEGDTARLQRYSGVFDARDPGSFLEFLTCCSRLNVSRAGGQAVISAPRVPHPDRR